jgi:hypothetical protein
MDHCNCDKTYPTDADGWIDASKYLPEHLEEVDVTVKSSRGVHVHLGIYNADQGEWHIQLQDCEPASRHNYVIAGWRPRPLPMVIPDPHAAVKRTVLERCVKWSVDKAADQPFLDEIFELIAASVNTKALTPLESVAIQDAINLLHQRHCSTTADRLQRVYDKLK